MVVFACNACGESLKKNQVENHYTRKCRNCTVLSCLDCGKDFWGNEYEQHTKCITEEEKYSGKNFVPKPGSNKNEIKQQQWLFQVQQAVDKCRTNPRLKSVLLRLKDQPNVPRKKNKFVNFLSNGFNVRDPNLASQVWDMLMENTETKKQENSQTDNKGNDKSDNNSTNNMNNIDIDTKADTNNKEETNNHVSENVTQEEVSKKLSKREKKEERRKKLHKAEKKDKQTPEEDDENVQVNGTAGKVSKKKSKRKGDSTDIGKTKKRKREEIEEDEEEEDIENTENQSDEDDNTDQPAKKKFKTKFNWNEIIVEALQSKGPEMKIKKLRKKVLAEYLSQGCTEKSEEKLWARFEKKLKKIPDVKVIGEKVKLKNAS